MKTFLTAIVLVITCQHTFAQSTDKLFETFRNEQGADYVKVSPLMMKGKIKKDDIAVMISDDKVMINGRK